MAGIRGEKGTIRGGLGRADHELLRSGFRFVDAILAVACVRGRFGFTFLAFALIGAAAGYVIRIPGDGIRPSPKEERAIMWSSIGEGVGLFLVANIVINLHRPDLLLPSMALVVGLHFLPIALAAGFRPYFVLGTALIGASIMGFLVGAPTGGELTGFMAAGALWVASGIAVRRDWSAKRRTLATV